ncbi:MAG TPA: DUF4288 domain-containing protein, partial [Syntrophales bacterium]
LKEPDADPLWEERIVLVQANSEEDAITEGTRIGKESEHEYAVAYGEKETKRDTLRWNFMQIEKVCEISTDNIKSGTELFSRFLRDSTIKSILTPFED